MAGVVYNPAFAPFMLLQFAPPSVDFCHWYVITSLVIDATILNVAVLPSITPWFCGCV